MDLLLCGTYADHDVDSDPVVVLQCEHVFTVETMDGHMGVRDAYEMDREGTSLAAV